MGIDQGSTGSKVIIVDPRGEVVCSESQTEEGMSDVKSG